MPGGFVYLTAVMDWYSRKVLTWEVSVTIDDAFCVSALEQAIRLYGKPKIFNTDQGSQFTGKTSYSIEIVKAQIKKTKDNGKPWDAKLGGVKADVFVEVWINGYLTPKAAFTTSVKKENHYPKWGEGTGLSLKPTDHINFMVWDKDAAQNDLIGECKTKVMSKQYTGEVWLKNCGQVDYLLVKITKN